VVGWAARTPRAADAEAAQLLDRALSLDGQLRAVASATWRCARDAAAARRQRLEDAVGGARGAQRRGLAIVHSGGKSYVELVRMRAGAPHGAGRRRLPAATRRSCRCSRSARPSASRWSRSRRHEHRRRVTALAGAQHAVVSLDLSRLGGMLAVDAAR